MWLRLREIELSIGVEVRMFGGSGGDMRFSAFCSVEGLSIGVVFESGWRFVVVSGGVEAFWCSWVFSGVVVSASVCCSRGGEIKTFITVHRHVAGGFTEIAFNGWTFTARVAELATLTADWLLVIMYYPTPFIGDLQ